MKKWKNSLWNYKKSKLLKLNLILIENICCYVSEEWSTFLSFHSRWQIVSNWIVTKFCIVVVSRSVCMFCVVLQCVPYSFNPLYHTTQHQTHKDFFLWSVFLRETQNVTMSLVGRLGAFVVTISLLGNNANKSLAPLAIHIDRLGWFPFLLLVWVSRKQHRRFLPTLSLSLSLPLIETWKTKILCFLIFELSIKKVRVL